MSIHDFIEKIKGRAGEHRQLLLFIGILAGTAVLSFYLGYVARAEGHKDPLVDIQCPANAYMDPVSLAVPQTIAPSPKSKTHRKTRA